MVDTWEIFNVEEHLLGTTECWVLDHRRPGDQNFMRMVFPKETVEWRAAEYDIDASTPEGRELILDIILHEPHMPPTLRPPEPIGKGRMLAMQRAKNEVHLYNAPTRAAAREAHLERVAQVKQNTCRVGWPKSRVDLRAGSDTPASMKQRIIDHEPNPEGIQEKFLMVMVQRAKLGLEKMPPGVGRTRQPLDPTVVRQNRAIAREQESGIDGSARKEVLG